MAKHIWSVLCERVLQDVDGQQLSLIGVAEELSIAEEFASESTAALAVNLAVASYWVREQSDVEERGYVRVDVRCPDASVIVGRELSVLLDRDWRAQTVGRIGSLPVRGAGRYEFRIHHRRDANCEWQLCAELPLELRVDDIEQ